MKKYKIKRKSIDEVRRRYIEAIIKNLEENKFTSDIDNLMQSFVYLILNDKFHRNIRKIRKSNLIALNGFIENKKYENWKNKERLNKLYSEVANFITKNNLSYVRYKPLIAELIKDYVLGKEFAPQAHISLVNNHFNYHNFVGGFDVPDPKIGRDSKIHWEVYLQPTDNLTQFKRSLKTYFVWFMNDNFNDSIVANTYETFKQRLFGANVRLKTPAELSISLSNMIINLMFISYPNTKTKEIERLFSKNQKRIMEIQKKLKKTQKENKAIYFGRKIKHYFCYLDGLSPSEAEWELYRKMKTPEERRDPRFMKRIIEIKTHYNEVRKCVSGALDGRLSL
jgi:hypothetical protein